MKELIGRKILGISVDDQRQDYLRFDTDAGPIMYLTDADCCSETWFADITGVHALLGGIVSAADEISMDGYNVDDGRTRQEEDQAYGYKITTDKGVADVVFRNSSNGYYGGWMSLCQKIPDSISMIPITDDWQAGAPSDD